MIRHLFLSLTCVAALSACDVPTSEAPAPQTPAPAQIKDTGKVMSPQVAGRAFVQVARRMEPLTEKACRERTQSVNCDFRIVVDDNPRAPSNAYQTLDANKRPIIIFTKKLIEEAKNPDELAFVLGHEAAHHIEGHIARQRQNAIAGAVIFTGLATLAGGNPDSIQSAQKIGATVGARTYSKEFELEADRLGTILTKQAGYDPLRGALFFNRIPDPGDRFLGTHPPNAQRMATVRKTAAGL